MRDKLEKALADEFPFVQWTPAITFWYGVECGDGWYPLIREMCREIAAALEAAGGPLDIVVEQVKEKYGQLDVIYRSVNHFDLIYDIVGRYEDRSAQVCEVCGAPGCLRDDLPYVRTLCREHYEQGKTGWGKKKEDSADE